ncbi:MAG: RNA 3'-phosphate cyclase [Polyangiaceae bacterium]|nr:RNA 3'-phosphate cyclase [Polyangiaceae bacterium]
MIQLDGTMGEGGGQVLRTALALSLATGRGFRVLGVRGRRKVPGLLRQHLVVVQAAARVSGARVTGAEVGSTHVTFEPRAIDGDAWSISVGSAGSATLVAQTLAPALLLRSRPSTVTIEGGTHNPGTPTLEFLAECWAPALASTGATLTLSLERHGFYPKGGGKIVLTTAASRLGPLDLSTRGALTSIEVRSALSESLPTHILDRELGQAGRRLTRLGPRLTRAHVPSDGHGNAMTLIATYERVRHVSTSLGELGVPAEEVADDLVNDFERFDAGGAAVGPHLADMLPVALALGDGGRFVTGAPTSHLSTQAALVPLFAPVTVDLSPHPDGTTLVEVRQRP